MRGDQTLFMILMLSVSSPIWTFGLGDSGGSRLQVVTYAQLLTDNDPPSITMVMPSASDLITNGTYANDTLTLSASVIDGDGVSRVVGSYSNRSEGVWHNVTMHMVTDYPDFYVADALNYTLRVSTGVKWDILIYANDTLGASSIKSWFLDVFCLYHTKPSTTTANGAGPDFAVAAAVITTAIIITVAVLLRPRKEAP